MTHFLKRILILCLLYSKYSNAQLNVTGRLIDFYDVQEENANKNVTRVYYIEVKISNEENNTVQYTLFRNFLCNNFCYHEGHFPVLEGNNRRPKIPIYVYPKNSSKDTLTVLVKDETIFLVENEMEISFKSIPPEIAEELECYDCRCLTRDTKFADFLINFKVDLKCSE